jgi:hypothetical protein
VNPTELSGAEVDLREPEELPEPMQFWERLVTVVLGAAAGGIGCYAVFETANQAGTAVLQADFGVDMTAETPTGEVAVVVKYRTRSPLTLQYVNMVVSNWKPDGTVGLLIVTNAPLSGDVREFNATVENRPPVEIITWDDERDDGILIRALGRVAR